MYKNYISLVKDVLPSARSACAQWELSMRCRGSRGSMWKFEDFQNFIFYVKSKSHCRALEFSCHSDLTWNQVHSVEKREFYFIRCSTVWKTWNSLSLKKQFCQSQIKSLVTSLVKTLLSRNFCENRVREYFCNFHTVCIKVQ